jgi:hydroxypyruvate reductase
MSQPTGELATAEQVVAIVPAAADLKAAITAKGYTIIDLPSLPEGPLPGYRVLLGTAMAGASAATFDRFPDAKLLASMGTGLENIDLDTARARGIAVLNTADVLTEDTADYAIALLYGIARRVVEADGFVRGGTWSKQRLTPSTRLFGKTCGIFGLGKIGQAVARRAQGIGMTVLWSGPRAKPGIAWEYVPDLATMVQRCDVLILTCPGNASTDRIIDAAMLERLGPAGFLVNIARGTVVDEPALVAALRAGTIRGAASDVFRAEPLVDPDVMGAPNLVLSPHYATVTHETRADMIAMLADGIEAFRHGRPHHDATKG